MVTNIYFKYNYEYSLYIRLGYDLFERERESNFVNQTMIENYFKLISTDMNFSFISDVLDDVLDVVLENYPSSNIVSLMTATFNAAIVLNNKILISIIINTWYTWKDTIKEVIETDEPNEKVKLKLLQDINNLESKIANYLKTNA